MIKRSYKVSVFYAMLEPNSMQAQTEISLVATSTDLARFLHALDTCPALESYTVSAPSTATPHITLTRQDLGLLELKKLK